MEYENWQCPVIIPGAISWLCTVCGRGGNALEAPEPAPEEVAEA